MKKTIEPPFPAPDHQTACTTHAAQPDEVCSQEPDDAAQALEFAAGWIDATLYASLWWPAEAVPPQYAAMLLNGVEPRHGGAMAAANSTNDEMGPDDYHNLLFAFETAIADKPRSLLDWYELAQARHLKTHSWVITWQKWLAVLESRQVASESAAPCKLAAPVQSPAPASTVDIMPALVPDVDPEDDFNIDEDWLCLPANTPGKLPLKNNGKLAIKAAWEIECKHQRPATAKEVMMVLQTWADAGTYPFVLISSCKAKQGVYWHTSTQKEKLYDVDAVSVAINRWHRSRR